MSIMLGQETKDYCGKLANKRLVRSYAVAAKIQSLIQKTLDIFGT